MKSQFIGTGYGASNYLSDSLNVMVADTRGSLAGVTNKLENMVAYAQANPQSSNGKQLTTYITKLEQSSKAFKQPATRPTHGFGL